MDIIHLIIRPHKNDIDIFEEIINKIHDYIDNITENYIYTIEKDNSLDRHLHLIMQVMEGTRMDNKLRNLKRFISKKITDRNSQLNVMLKTKTAKQEHDKKMVVGYVCKDVNDADLEKDRTGLITRPSYRHYVKGELEYPLLQCKKYYLSHSIEIKKESKTINIEPKYAVAQCEEILEKLQFGKNGIIPQMFTEMVHLGYSFLKLSRYQKKQLYLELKIRNDPDITQELLNKFEIDFIADDLNPKSLELYYENLEKIKTIKSNKLTIWKLYKLGFFSQGIEELFTFDELNELKIYQ